MDKLTAAYEKLVAKARSKHVGMVGLYTVPGGPRPRRLPRYTLEPGRHIYRDGQPFISVGREGKTEPWAADDAAHVITELLNRVRRR